MRVPRIYVNCPLQVQFNLELDKEIAHRLIKVLRVEKDQPIILFNGDGHEYLGEIIQLKKERLQIKITKVYEKNLESPLDLHLGQVISKGEKMDFVIQKATELGITRLTPLFSERCVVHLKHERIEKKKEHWEKIMIHAAEQCGRTTIPILEKPMNLKDWVHERSEKTRLMLALSATLSLSKMEISNAIALLIGPEGGLTLEEIDYAIQYNFMAIKLGPRVLRTETATLVAVAALQFLAGDLGNGT